jgi:hypothetical protein
MSIGARQFWWTVKNGSALGPVTPNALLLSWWTSLSVKPSDALMTDLNTLSAGLDADGNWSKLDLFGLVAGMETQEQRLRPLITTSGDNFVIEGTPVLNVNGVNSNLNDGYLDLKWNPVDDGVQYTLNSAFISTYISDNAAGANTIGGLGSFDTILTRETDILYIGGDELAVIVNADNAVTYPNVINTDFSYHAVGVIFGGNWIIYRNAATQSIPIDGGSPALVSYDFYGADVNADGAPSGYGGDAYLRHFMAGAGTANQTNIQARLNTFYTARGL